MISFYIIINLVRPTFIMNGATEERPLEDQISKLGKGDSADVESWFGSIYSRMLT